MQEVRFGRLQNTTMQQSQAIAALQVGDFERNDVPITATAFNFIIWIVRHDNDA
jgi:hypothetical protein